MNIYVGNLPYSVTDEDLKELFEQFGAVTSARVINDRETGRSKGFGFVEMPVTEEGNTAVESTNGSEFQGRPLRVNETEPRPSFKGGGGGGRPQNRGGGFKGGGHRGGGGGGGGGRDFQRDDRDFRKGGDRDKFRRGGGGGGQHRRGGKRFGGQEDEF